MLESGIRVASAKNGPEKKILHVCTDSELRGDGPFAEEEGPGFFFLELKNELQEEQEISLTYQVISRIGPSHEDVHHFMTGICTRVLPQAGKEHEKIRFYDPSASLPLSAMTGILQIRVSDESFDPGESDLPVVGGKRSDIGKEFATVALWDARDGSR